MPDSGHECAIVDDKALVNLSIRYMGVGPTLTHDETEILLFALYVESQERGGMIADAAKELPNRLRAADRAKLAKPEGK